MGPEAWLRIRWHRTRDLHFSRVPLHVLPLDTRVAVLRHTHILDLFFAASMHGQTSSTQNQLSRPTIADTSRRRSATRAHFPANHKMEIIRRCWERSCGLYWISVPMEGRSPRRRLRANWWIVSTIQALHPAKLKCRSLCEGTSQLGNCLVSIYQRRDSTRQA